MPFGSIVTGMAITNSDADCYVQIPERFKDPKESYVKKAEALFRRHPHIFRQVMSIPRAKVPIVKFFHVPTKRECDLSFTSPAGVYNSELIGFMFTLDPRVLPLAIIIKYWSKVHNLTGTNLFSNYSLLMLIMFYLQEVNVLPSVEWMQENAEPRYVDNWNSGFLANVHKYAHSENNSPLHRLLGGFFEYYSRFDFGKYVVSPFVGHPVERDCFKILRTVPKNFKLYKELCGENKSKCLLIDSPFCIQDVFDHSRNCASFVPPRIGKLFLDHIKLAAKIYESSSTNQWETFLKELLTVSVKAPPPNKRRPAHAKIGRRNNIAVTNAKKFKKTLRVLRNNAPREPCFWVD